MTEMIVASILTAEQDYGTVAAIDVPADQVDATRAALETVGRGDLSALVSTGEAGCVYVDAGGSRWRFGGL